MEKIIKWHLTMLIIAIFILEMYINAGFAGIVTTATSLPVSQTGFEAIFFFTKAPSKPLANSIFLSTKITGEELNRSIAFARSVVNKMQRLETNLVWSNIYIKKGTPSHGLLINYLPDQDALVQGFQALIAAKASVQLMNQFCDRYDVSPADCAKYLSAVKFSSTPLQSACGSLHKKCSADEMLSKYRSIDGSCNHKNDMVSGHSYTGYRRLLFPDYSDGIQEPRRSVVRRHTLLSPRAISVSLVQHRHLEPSYSNGFTSALTQWGQFIEHDLSHTALSRMIYIEKSIECCSEDGSSLLPRYIHPFCAPIPISSEDEFYSQHNRDCMSYVRSVPALRPDCTFGPVEQLNLATHLLDGSSIYGSTLARTRKLRSYVDGKLDISLKNHKEFLPTSTQPTQDCQVDSDESTCFISGDSRVNEYPQATVMHTLWHREHNRIADELANINPHWDDETLFQEARRIVIAEIQQITYNEWIPKILGQKYVAKIMNKNTFIEEVDPSVSNSFTTAAIRFIYTLLSSQISLYDEERSLNASLTLREYFNKPALIQKPGYLDALIRGLATQPSQKLSINYANDVTNYLYSNGEYGFDILSLDIQRGRDHGLPSYTSYRRFCGLPEGKTFQDFLDVMPSTAVEMLSKAYINPHDVDLIVGGLLENPDGDSLLGPTFSCIVAEQFERTKNGDRYFYSNMEQPKPFSDAQIREIEKIRLARIFCDNGDDLTDMQPEVFKLIDNSNRILRCSSDDIPRLSLDLWSDNNYSYTII